jgi:hypothetical protein
MSEAEFRQWAMIYALQGMLANSRVSRDYAEVAKAAVYMADALLEANTIDEVTKSETP